MKDQSYTQMNSVEDNDMKQSILSTDSDVFDKENDLISIPRATIVLINIITGIGILGIPYCFCAGIGTNFIIILFIASFSMFSFSLLVDCGSRTGVKNYPKLINIAFPNKKLQWIPDLIILITLFGASILYLQFSQSLIISVLKEIHNIPKFLYNKWFVAFVLQCVFLIPLVLLKSISALSFVSFVSTCLVLLYIIHSIFYFGVYLHDHGFNPDNQLKIFSFDLKKVIPALSIQSTSYTCHPNIFPTLEKLKNPSQSRMNLTMFFVTAIATILYSICGIFPYLTLFDKIEDPVVLNYYEKGQVFTIVIKACYGVLLILTVPLLLFTFRLSFNQLAFKSDFTSLRWYIIGVVSVLVSCLIAVTVEEIKVMFNFVGGVNAPLLVYILPSLYYLRICKNTSKIKEIFCYISIVVGLAFIAICLYDSISSLIK